MNVTEREHKRATTHATCHVYVFSPIDRNYLQKGMLVIRVSRLNIGTVVTTAIADIHGDEGNIRHVRTEEETAFDSYWHWLSRL